MARRSSRRWLALALVGALRLSAAPSPDLESSYRQASQLYEHGYYALALEKSTEARQRAGTDNSDVALRLRVLSAVLLALRGFPKEALTEASFELPQRLKTTGLEVQRLRVLAMASYRLVAYEEALKYINMAIALAKAKAPHELAEAMNTKSNFSKVLPAGERESLVHAAALLAHRDHNTRMEATILASLAKSRADQERFDESIDIGRKALVLAERGGYVNVKQLIQGNLAWAYEELGDHDEAEPNLIAAIEIAEKIGATVDVMPWRMLAGGMAQARSDLPLAARYYRAALATATSLKNEARRGDALANLATVALDAGNYDGAQQFNADALAAKTAAKDEEGVLRSRIIEARIDLATKHLSPAETTLTSVLAEARAASIQFEAESLLARVFVAKGDGDAAVQHFQKAVDLVDAARKGINSADLKLSYAQVVAALYGSYVDFLAGSGKTEDALRVTELSRARTLAEGLKLERERDADFDPEGVAKAANVTVLSYWLGPSRSFLFVITPDGVKQFQLPAAHKIEPLIDAYQKEVVSGPGVPEAHGLGAELYDTLLGHAAASIGGSRIAIIPDGRLATFNFETLVVRSPRPHYWIQDVTIETATTLRFVAGTRPSTRGGSILLVGNAPPEDPLYPPLKNAAKEIAGIERRFEKRHTTLALHAATPQAYESAALGTYAFIHFVAHGVATQQRPLDSAVILGRDATGYKLYARDIMARPLRASLVTISSCHGAGRRAFQGEGLVGLAWAFLHAGAHEVIAALWQVDDAATPELMNEMYAAIGAGQPPADALRAAKLKLLSSKTFYGKPRYWAPFVLYSGS